MALLRGLRGNEFDPGEFSELGSILQNIAPTEPARGGVMARLMSALADPRVNAMLIGASQRLGEAGAPSMTPKSQGLGAALSAGFLGANEGAQSYEESLAKRAADSLRRKMDERRLEIEEERARRESENGTAVWNTDLSNQIGILSRQYMREAAESGKEMTLEQAQENALHDIRTMTVRERQKLQDDAQDHAVLMEQMKPTIAGEIEKTRQAEIRDSSLAAKATDANTSAAEMESLGAEASELIDKSSGSYFGKLAADARARLNIADETSRANRSLEVLAGELVAQFARTQILGVNPSAADLESYKLMAGKISDATLDQSVRKAALQTVIRRARARAEAAARAAGQQQPAGQKQRTAKDIRLQYRSR